MSNAEGAYVHIWPSQASALEQVAQTIGQADGLPAIEFTMTRHVDGYPLVLVETLDAYDWANHLHLDWVADTKTGEVEFSGVVDGVHWSILYLPRTTQRATDWASPIHHTQVIAS